MIEPNSGLRKRVNLDFEAFVLKIEWIYEVVSLIIGLKLLYESNSNYYNWG